MASSSVPLRAFEILHILNDLLTISSGVSSHDCFTQRRSRFFDGAFFFPAGVYSKGPVIILLRYFRCMLSLNGLLRHLSNGCRTGVRPPGITRRSCAVVGLLSLTLSDGLGKNPRQAVTVHRKDSMANRYKSKAGVKD